MNASLRIAPLICRYQTVADMPIPMDMPMARSAVARKDVFPSRSVLRTCIRCTRLLTRPLLCTRTQQRG